MTFEPDTREIWVDARAAEDPAEGLRGIGRYVLEHSRALLGLGDPRMTLVRDSAIAPTPRTRWMDAVDGREAYAAIARPPAIYHAMSPFQPLWPLDQLWPRAARGADSRLVLTAYDLIPAVLPEYRLHGGKRTQYDARVQLLRRADHLLAISEVTAADLLRVAGVSEDRISVIGAGVSPELDHGMPVSEAREVLRERYPELVSGGFPLYVGGADPRKNLEPFIAAWGRVVPEVRAERRIVICGHAPPDRVAAFERAAVDAGLAPGDLVQTGYVSDRELSALYRLCGAFVFPSTYEGSGMPMLEAMAFGIVVIAADASTAPEVLGDSFLGFDPHDADGFAGALTQALTDDDARERLRVRSRARAARYTWGRTAELTLDAYERALARPSRGIRRSRRRVHWRGVELPAPVPTGIELEVGHEGAAPAVDAFNRYVGEASTDDELERLAPGDPV